MEKQKKMESYDDHHQKCYKMFNRAFDGEKIYIHVDEIDEYNRTIVFGIVTEEMVIYDSEFMSDSKAEYRPYFFSFETHISNQLESYLDKSNSQRSEDGLWLVAKFISENESNNVESSNVIEGYVMYAASPVFAKKKRIKLIYAGLPKKIRDRINKTYKLNPVNDVEAKKRLDNTFSCMEFDYLDVFNAGHANVIRLRGRKTGKYASVLVDVGKHGGYCGSVPKEYPKTDKALSKMKPSAVILSHWDLDHILGVTCASAEMFECQWYAPDLGDMGTNAKRLACYLHYKKKLTLIERKRTDRLITSIKGLTIYMGRNAKVDDIDKQNCGGIVVSYEIDKVKTLVCGDAPYKAVESALWKTKPIYDYIIVPHHAHAMTVKKIVTKRKSKGYSVYCNNEKGDAKHLNDLDSLGYENLHTEDIKKRYYSIDLKKLKKPVEK